MALFLNFHDYRGLDKRGYLMIIEGYFLLCLIKPYDGTSHLNRLNEMVQMRGTTWFYAKLTKIIPNYHQIPPLI